MDLAHEDGVKAFLAGAAVISRLDWGWKICFQDDLPMWLLFHHQVDFPMELPGYYHDMVSGFPQRE